MWTALIIEFIAFSFIGWAFDSLYRSVEAGLALLAPLFVGPFAPIYGLAIVLAHLILKSTKGWADVWRILLTAAAMTGLELLGGMFCTQVLGFTLWKYPDGYTDSFHALIWLLCMIIFYYLIFPQLEKLETKLRAIPLWLDITILLVFGLSFAGVVAYRTIYWHGIYGYADDSPNGYTTRL